MLKALCHSSQAGGSSCCPPALPSEPCPSPTRPSLPWGTAGWFWGLPVLLGLTLQAGPVTASEGLAWGALLHCPPWGKWFLCALQTLHAPLNPRQDNRPHPVSCRVALQIDRVGTALQLPVPPYLEPDTLPWGSTLLGGLWHTGLSCGTWGSPHPLCGTSLGDTQAPLLLWGTRPQGRAGLEY